MITQERTALPEGSLIVCSRNRPALLRACVQSILDGTDLPSELIVVDQSHSADPIVVEMQAVAGHCDVRYYWMNTPGLSRALNFGIRAAKFDVLVFTHDDVSVDVSWYRSIVSTLVAHDHDAIVTGRVLPERPDTARGFVPSIKTDPLACVFSGRIWEDVLYPMNMAMSRATYEAVGRFDERLGPGTPYPAAEDNDFGFRALECGCAIVYAPSAVVWHRAFSENHIRVRWRYALGQGAFFAKHIALKDGYIAQRVALESGRWVRAAISRAVRLDTQAVSHVAGSIGLVAGVVLWMVRHRLRSGNNQ